MIASLSLFAAAEALALAWLASRFGRRGLVWGIVAAVVSWGMVWAVVVG
jgi:hypothetical protein